MIGYIIAFWIVCGFIAYGFIMSAMHTQRFSKEFRKRVVGAITLALFGPLTLCLIWENKDYKHGWKLW